MTEAAGRTDARWPINLSRRAFLCGAGGSAGTLLLGIPAPAAAEEATPFEDLTLPPVAVTAFVKISPTEIVLVLPRSEMGQGVSTVLPMLLAEELACDWERVRVEMAPVHSAYLNPAFGIMATGASTSLRSAYEPLRRAGAAAREMLRAAAAQLWDVAPIDCSVVQGVIRHAPSGRAASYGALAPTAAHLPVPTELTLKPPERWRLLGRSLARLDLPAKTAGTARFGLDVVLPDMAVALIRHCPMLGGRFEGFDDSALPESLRRQVTIVPLEDRAALAVLADRTWIARKALKGLTLTWRRGRIDALSDAQITARLESGLAQETRPAEQRGDAGAALAEAARRLTATYRLPFLAHATPEPTCCTARVVGNRCELWAPTQGQTMLARTVALSLGLPPDHVTVHTTLLGGGFGRRYETDAGVEAARLARTLDRPVKVIWDRDEDFRRDVFRPASLSQVEVGLDADGWPVGWRHAIAAPSILQRTFPHLIEDGIDQTATEGILDQPYAIPHMAVRYAMVDTGVPVGFWRSVGRSNNTFAVESVLDEVAASAGHDPLALRRRLLRDDARALAVLDAVARLSDWEAPNARPARDSGSPEARPGLRHGRGLAFHQAYRSYLAMVVEVSVAKDGRYTVPRIAIACDVGRIIHPDCVEQQIRGGTVFALSAAAREAISLADGQVSERDFDTYPLLRMAEMPEIAVTLLPSADEPGGVGELAVPPVAPALTNALFAATGERLRALPLRHAGFDLTARRHLVEQRP